MYIKIALISFFLICSLLSGAQNTISYNSEDYHFKTGLELLDKKKFGAARQEFEKYLALEDDNLKAKEAEYYIAYSALRLYNSDGEKLVAQFVEENQDHPKALLAYYELGNFYFKGNDYNKAIDYFEKVEVDELSQDQQLETQFKLAYSYFTRKDFNKALQQFNKIKTTNNRYTYASSYYAGFVEYRNEEYSQALVDLQRAEQNEAYAAIVPYMIANVYYQQKRWDDLIDYGEQVLEKANLKNEEEISLLTGEAYYQKNNFESAAKYFENYLENKKGTPDTQVLYRIAYTQYATGNNNKAIENFKAVAAANDTISQYASYYLGELYVKENNKPFAVTAFDKARSLDFNSDIKEQAAFSFAKVSYDLGKYNETIQALDEYLKAYPNGVNSREANDLLSEAYLNTNNYNQAIQHIESLPSKSDRVKRAYQKVTFYKGTEYFNNAKFYNAVQLFDKSLQYPLDQEFMTMANFWSGEAYTTGRKYDEAINSYGAVFRTATPNNIYHLKARYGIGYAYYNSGQYDKALEHFKLYVNRLENAKNKLFYNDALLRLADTYYVTKSYDQALKYYEQAIGQDNPDKDYAYFQKGIVLGIQGNISDARSSFDVVLNNFSRSTYTDDALFQKSQLDFEQGNYDAAINGFTQLIQNKEQSGFVPLALLRRAIAYSNLQQYDQTEQDYKRILNEYPTHEAANSALSGLQQVLTNKGDLDEFDNYLAKYKTANPDDQALQSVEYESAKNLYFSQDYEKAITRFKDYIKSYPNTNFAYEAKYYIGESYYRMNQIENALEYHYGVIKDDKIDRTNRSIQRVAELEYMAGDYDQAVDYYIELANIAATKKEQYNAWSGLMESYYKLNNFDSVDFYAQLILEKGNVSANAQNKANLFMGKAAYSRGDYEKAKDEFLSVINSAKDENGAEAQYLTAEIFYKNAQYQESIEKLYDLNKNYSLYEEWLGKSFLLIADNYIALDENFQAKATLQSLIEKSPLQGVVDQAKAKLLRLEQEEKEEVQRQKNEIDTTQYQIIDNEDTSVNEEPETTEELLNQDQ